MLLAGDAGGTKTVLALCSKEDGKLVRHKIDTFATSSFKSLADIIMLFLTDNKEKLSKACVGIAGPVIDGKVNTTNFPWELDEKVLSQELGIEKFSLVNDLTANAAAVPHLGEEDLHTIYPGEGKNTSQTSVVMAPGTGLGQAFIYTNGGKNHILTSEGGHADFAPKNKIELELLAYLQKTHDHVSWERIISGMGLINIFSFLKDSYDYKISDELAEHIESSDLPSIITKSAFAGTSEISTKTLDIFASVFGTQAGNLALTLMGTKGIFLGGGIPPKIISKLEDGTFLKAFFSKGRMGYLLKPAPIHIVKSDLAALDGAAHLASEL